MANILSAFYPPLIDTFQSPFIYDETPEISFSISPYNSYNEIKKIHVTLINQKTNQNMFSTNESVDNTVSINGVWIVPFDLSNSWLSGDNEKNTYTLKIPRSILKQKTYVCDCYYKVQLRLDTSSEPILNNGKIVKTYLNDERASFSEWSSVSLLKAIPKISVTLANFDIVINGEKRLRTPSFVPGVLPIVGSVKFSSNNGQATNEHLDSFEIDIKDSTGKVFKNSGTQFVKGNTNTFSWLVDLTNLIEVIEEENSNQLLYSIVLYLTTNNGYTFTKKYNFRAMISGYDINFNPNWSFNKIRVPSTSLTVTKQTLVTSEDGWANITITNTNQDLSPGYLFIKRATNLDNYLNWEILCCYYIKNGGAFTKSFHDKTIGSLVGYKYSCQYITIKGQWSKTYITNEIVYPDFHDILISRGDKQLAIRYNGQIASMTPVVNRIKVDTLGGKYPRFVQNARTNYKQFQLSGLITAEADFNRKFISDKSAEYADKMDLYNSHMNGKYMIRNDTVPDLSANAVDLNNIDPDAKYGQFYYKHDTYPTENWWWEREFREQVVEWLNDGEPKLFRSMTEGNMIVMFDSISLTPNQQLGRRIWNFSATVYEVGDGYSLTELDSLGIFPIENAFNISQYISTSGKEIKINKTQIGRKTGYIADINANTGASSTLITTSKPFRVRRSYTRTSNQDTSSKTLQTWVPPIRNDLNNLYKGLNENYKIKLDSIYLTDVKIYFENNPQYYTITNSNNNLDIKLLTDSSNITSSSPLGYKLGLKFSGDNDFKVFFVSDKLKYYQVPSDIKVTEIALYDKAQATIDYKIHYTVFFDNPSLPEYQDFTKEISGQINNNWKYGEYIINWNGDMTNNPTALWTKYYHYEIEEAIIKQYIKLLTYMSFESTVPGVILKINNKEEVLVGNSRTLTLGPGYEITDCQILGRRLFKTTNDVETLRSLNEGEFCFDPETCGVGKSAKLVEEITNPISNYIYKLTLEKGGTSQYYLWYNDEEWISGKRLKFNSDKTTVDIEVPVDGIVNYIGELWEDINI